MKNKKWIGMFLILVVYAWATLCGIVLYYALPFTPWLSLLVADVAATAVTFIFSLLLKNASVYDPYWSVQPMVIGLCFALTKPLNGARILMLVAVFYWGVRLTTNWAYTFKNLNHQDWRYTMLKEKTGKFYPLVNFLGIHLFPTLVVYACVLPMVFTFLIDYEMNVFSMLFFALSIVATTLQLVTDLDMQKFRKAGNRGFIRTGLWKYSRHPNYLGEILMWWGVALFFITAVPSMWYLAAGAIINTLMFLFVSIPMADKRQSEKAGFREYKTQTRMLLPIKK